MTPVLMPFRAGELEEVQNAVATEPVWVTAEKQPAERRVFFPARKRRFGAPCRTF